MGVMRIGEPISKVDSFSRTNTIVWLIFILFIFSSVLAFFPSQASSTPRQNNPPDAVIDSPDNADVYGVNELVHFDASSSSDPDNDP